MSDVKTIYIVSLVNTIELRMLCLTNIIETCLELQRGQVREEKNNSNIVIIMEEGAWYKISNHLLKNGAQNRSIDV